MVGRGRKMKMYRPQIRLLFGCLLLAGLLSCAPRQDVEPQPVTVSDAQLVELLAGRAWVAEYIQGRPVMDMSHSSMIFTTNGMVKGRGGCNVFSGTYTLKDGKLSFGPLAATMKMCAPAVSDQEERFFQSLKVSQRVSFHNGLLQLSPDDGKPSVFAEQKMD